jgi:hypothetical protein
MSFNFAALNLTCTGAETFLEDFLPFSDVGADQYLARLSSLFKRDFGTPRTLAVSSAEADRASIRVLILFLLQYYNLTGDISTTRSHDKCIPSNTRTVKGLVAGCRIPSVFEGVRVLT